MEQVKEQTLPLLRCPEKNMAHYNNREGTDSEKKSVPCFVQSDYSTIRSFDYSTDYQLKPSAVSSFQMDLAAPSPSSPTLSGVIESIVALPVSTDVLTLSFVSCTRGWI